MQTFIDFLVNNYLWFIIISFILIFALIGYLVDTNEKKNKEESFEDTLDASNIENIKVEKTAESANMDMGLEEKNTTLEKDVIIMPNIAETPLENTVTESTEQEQEEDETELLDI